MEKIEYRYLKEDESFEPLYHYNLDEIEAATRKLCEFYVKENTVYQVVSIALEPTLTVIYVKHFDWNKKFVDERTYYGVSIEIRKFSNYGDSPVIKVHENITHLEVLKYLQSDYIYIHLNEKKYLEYKLMATEIDEERSTYVYYVEPTDIVVEY